ncbi:MAG: NosD domain-containing protein [Candidatus Bathyarchaeota archaeon]
MNSFRSLLHYFLVFILIFSVISVEAVFSQNIEQNFIYIRSDGSIQPETSSIEQIGNIYRLLDDIHGSLIVEKDNVVIDGDGFSLLGTNSSDYHPAIPAFDITQPFNQTIREYDESVLPQSNNTGIYSHFQKLKIINLKITGFWCAIELEDSSDNTITDNIVFNNTQGVWIHTSSNNTISKNNIKNNKQGLVLTSAYTTIQQNNISHNSEYAIKLFWSFNNLFENRISNNGIGVNFQESTHNIFRNNSFLDNSRLFIYTRFSEFIQDVDDSNHINGKPILFWENKNGKTVPSEAGYVSLVNCTRIWVENLNFSFGQQIVLVSTKDSTITNNMLSDNQFCIYLKWSSNNVISNNSLTHSEVGLILDSSSKNDISYNNFSNNFGAVTLSLSDINNIQFNNIIENKAGITLRISSNNFISFNNLTSNNRGIILERLLETRDWNNPINSTIIYGCQNNKFLRNQISQNQYGVWMSSASNNIFSGNNFIDNNNQTMMYDSSDLSYSGDPEAKLKEQRFASINFWDQNKQGNYWNNNKISDSNTDGIGDKPYILNENNQDNYPLMQPTNISIPFEQHVQESDPIYIILAIVAAFSIIIVILFFNRRKSNKPQV